MNARSFGASLGAKAIQTFLVRVAAMVVALATGIVIARVLGPGGKGVYSGVQVLLSVPLALTGGAGAAITFLMAKERWSVRDIFPTLAITFFLATFATAVGAVAYGALGGWNTILFAFLAATPAAIIVSWQSSFYVACNRIRRLNAQTLALAVLTLLAVCTALYVFRAGVVGVLAAWICCTYAIAIAMLLDMRASGATFHKEQLGARLRTFSRIGSQSALNTALGVVNYRVDSFILVALLGLSAFGVYSIAVSVGEALFLLSRPITTAVSREIGASDGRRAAEITARTIRLTVVLSAIVGVAIFLIAPALIHLVYGNRFDGASAPLRALLPGIVAFSSAGTFASFFIFQMGRPLTVAAINAVMIAAQIAACVLLVPRFGMIGAAAGSSLTYGIGALVNTWCFWKCTGIRPDELWIPRRKDFRRAGTVLLELLPHRRSLPPKVETNVVVLTGAAGNVGTLVRGELASVYRLLSSDARSIGALLPGERFVKADLRDLAAVREVIHGARAIVHFGGISKEHSFEAIFGANIVGTYNIFEAARLEGVKRIVFASSGHVTGFSPRDKHLDEYAPLRPDTLYAVSKVFGEALGRFYADKYGLEVLCIRIGHVTEKPRYAVDRHIWISPADLLQLVRIGIERADLHYEIVYGVSDNPERWWSLDRAEQLGYEAQATVAGWMASLASNGGAPGIGDLVQGESFAASGFQGNLDRLMRGS